jgi:hypothetical protein
MRDTKLYIYTHLSQNPDFLNALVSKDITTLLRILTTQINQNNRNNCGDPTANCDIEVERMIFTLSLYSFLQDQIPEADDNYQTIQTIFTVENIQNPKIDPTIYFYYKQPIYIPNLFSTIQDIYNGTTTNSSGDEASPSPSSNVANAVVQAATSNNGGGGGGSLFTDPDRELIFITQLTTMLQTANKKLARLQSIAQGKETLFKYMIVFAIMATFIAIAFGALYYPDLKKILASIGTIVKSTMATSK